MASPTRTEEWAQVIKNLSPGYRPIQYYVLGFAIIGNEVVLIEKAKPEWQKGLFNGVGGKVEKGETPLDAMVREFQEETGAMTMPHEWTYRGTMIGAGWNVDVYVARLNHGTIVKTMESEEVHRVKITDLAYVLKKVENIDALIELCTMSVGSSGVLPTFILHY